MTTLHLPFISVQADWDQVAQEVASGKSPNTSFWIACYITGKPSVQGSIQVTKKDNEAFELEGKNGFSVSSLDSHMFKVKCDEIGVKDILVQGPTTEIALAEKTSLLCISVSQNGKLFAAGNGSNILLGNIAEGEVQKTLTGHLSDVTTVQFFPSNLVLLSGGADFLLKIWSAIDGSNPVTLKGHTSAITSTAIIEKGRNVLSSSRDGTIKLWNCGTSSTIATLGNYNWPVNKIILTKLPLIYQPAEKEKLDPLEVGTEDKLVLAALGDGSVRGIHLGTKTELFVFRSDDYALTALAYDEASNLIFTGNENGQIYVYSLAKHLKEPVAQWQRNKYPITSLVPKLSRNGELVLCASSADGGLYQTSSLSTIHESGSNIQIEIEYTGSDLEAIKDMEILPSEKEGYQHIICSVSDGKVKIY
ncbi:hypothetical protein G6F42_008970 [Rhizopus arrhizus]|nr:hypothetical protein G6F42_008970 [Rhizopus arrhizus]